MGEVIRAGAGGTFTQIDLNFNYSIARGRARLHMADAYKGKEYRPDSPVSTGQTYPLTASDVPVQITLAMRTCTANDQRLTKEPAMERVWNPRHRISLNY